MNELPTPPTPTFVLMDGEDNSKITLKVSCTVAVVACVTDRLPYIIGVFTDSLDAIDFMDGITMGLIKSPSFDPDKDGFMYAVPIKDVLNEI